MAGQTLIDRQYMQIALRLAERALGNAWPNPAVGCVIVRDGQIVGRGWTQPGGRPHAETEALGRAGELANGATAYVSLEPCAHEGETGACATALAEAGIAEAVIAVTDPDPRVRGQGAAILSESGIPVRDGVCGDEAELLNAGFFSRIRRARPWVTLKVAASLDGKIALANGESQWITSEAARESGHLLRARNDAILVGRGTVAADNPSLTCRLPGLEELSPVRVVLDTALTTSREAQIFTSAREVPTWVITASSVDDQAAKDLAEVGVRIISVPADNDSVNLSAALEALAREGITRLLVEGGAELSAALFRADLVDEVVWYSAPSIVGGDGLNATAALGFEDLEDIVRLAPVDSGEPGPDLYRRFLVDR